MIKLQFDLQEPFPLPWDKEVQARFPKPKTSQGGRPMIDLSDGVRINKKIEKAILSYPHMLERIIIPGDMADHRAFQRFKKDLIAHRIEYRHQILVYRSSAKDKVGEKCRFFYFFKDETDANAAKIMR